MVVEPLATPASEPERPELMPLTQVRARLAVLERSPTLFGCSASQLRFLARRARSQFVPQGRILVRQGDQGDTMYLVASGHCEVSVAESPGHAVTVSVLGPGDALGEEAVVGDGTRLASVRAVDEVEVLVLDRDTVDQVMPAGGEQVEELRRLVEQRRTTIRLLVDRSKSLAPKQSATRIAVYSPKGGSGRTTVALNVAAQLARQHPGEVLVADLALPYNHAALMTNLVPTGSLAQLTSVGPDHFEEALLSVILHHPSGVMILPGVVRPEEAELITPELLDRSLEVLNRDFRYIVFDLSQHLGDIVLSVLERAHRVLIVATPELSSLKDVVEVKRIFGDVLKILPARLAVTVNYRAPKGLLSLEDVEANLQQPVVCEIPYEGTRLDEAAVHGEILSVSDPKSSIARASSAIADVLTGSASAAGRAPRRRFGIG